MARSLTKNGKHVYIFDNPATIADFLIEKWREISGKIIDKKDNFTVALSGGKTPVPFLQKLAQQTDLPWLKTHIFLVDERMVPPTDSNSNYRVIKENLLDPLAFNEDNIHYIHTNTTAQKAAQRYETDLTMFFNLQETALPQFDLIILGIGEDGHTASLFPNDPLALENRWLTIAVQNGQEQYKRVSLALPVINNAKHIIFLASGANKAKIINAVIEQQNLQLPATKVAPQYGDLLFLLDEAAGKLLHPDLYQLSFYVPNSHLESVKTALFQAGAGKLGNYNCCAWQTKGTGQFRPQAGSKPFIGKPDQIEKVDEYKVEMLCDAENVTQVITALKASHPYEEPAYNIIKLEHIKGGSEAPIRAIAIKKDITA